MNKTPQGAALSDADILPCPFCGAGTTQLRENGRIWSGMKYSEPSSVSVEHWCEKVAGQPSRMIERVGRDTASAIEAWNLRAADRRLTAEQGGADDRDSIMWTVCRMALTANNSEAMRHQVSRLIAVSTGHAKQALQAMLIRAEQATQKPHVIAGPRAKLEWQGSPQPSDLLAKITAWGHSTGGFPQGAAWDEIVAALTTQPQAVPADKAGHLINNEDVRDSTYDTPLPVFYPTAPTEPT